MSQRVLPGAALVVALCGAAVVEAGTWVTAPNPASNTVNVTAETTVASFKELQVFIDDSHVLSCTRVPCGYRWNTRTWRDGTHQLAARLIGWHGTAEQASRSVSVANDSQPPSVSLAAPSVASQTVTLSASAKDHSGSGISFVEIRVGDVRVAHVSGNTASVAWNSASVPDGDYKVQAFASDNSGNLGASKTNSMEVHNGVAATPVPTRTPFSSVTKPSPTPPVPTATPTPSAPPAATATATPTPSAPPAATATAKATAAPTVGTQSSVPGSIDKIIDPVTVLGAPSGMNGIAIYDSNELQRGRIDAEAFPSQPSDLVSSNYYDLALTLYTLYRRSGDVYWRDKARYVAATWRDSVNNQNIEKYLAGDYSVGPTIPPARSMATLGLAILALETGDAGARRIVNDHARLVEEAFGFNWSDARETGYSLIALVASTVLGDDHRASALKMLETILAQQKPDGHWEQTSDLVPNNQPFVLNYMSGLLMEGLIFYDRNIGDARILPAIQRCLDWTWNTQWLSSALAFQYGNINSGSVTTQPAGDLSGLMLPAWGYALARTGDVRYRDQGAQIFTGLVNIIPGALTGEKHFAQIYRSSGRYLGFVSQTP